MSENKNLLDELFNKKNELEENLKEINIEIQNLQYKIINECEHSWIREREEGQYGKLWTYCSKCRVDKFNKSFIH
jgi:hypothetical protein